MKLAILIFDGVGIRNFAFSRFFSVAKKEKINIQYWNRTPFRIQENLHLPEVRLPAEPLHPLIDTIKSIRQWGHVRQLAKQTGKKEYLYGIKGANPQRLNAKIKLQLVKAVSPFFATGKRRFWLERQMERLAKKTTYYQQVKKLMEQEKPGIVLLTHQRPLAALEPVLAARELGIPTVGFIFSWDNLPKATINVKTDYYLVWSDYMKEEMKRYYPEIPQENVFVTGTPQFEVHYDKNLLMSREDFFKWLDQDPEKKYVLYSGDDIRTSPNDEYFVEDLAKAVRVYNKRYGANMHILLRPVPVDFSPRYNEVIEKYKDVVTLVRALWKAADARWTSYFPTPDDGKMLSNLAEHCEAVFNVGSSMVFDFVAHDKPTVYMNYLTEKINNPAWSPERIYRLIHFESMPDKNAVLWAKSSHDLLPVLERIMRKDYSLKATRRWYEKINVPPPQLASQRIIEQLKQISKK